MPFDRAGFAALSDFRAPGYGELFARLESAQSEFLAQLPRFADSRYPWDRDTLHNWSRAWEYAFVLHHLMRERDRTQGRRLHVLDFGSGSTFFPFAVARLGFDLVCLDNDPVVVDDLQKAATVLDARPGSIEVRLNDERLPIENAWANAAYSVSVLEHMPDPVSIVKEVVRVLRRDGLFLLTMDIDVEGEEGVSPGNFDRLRHDLESFFQPEFPERSVHPFDMLTTKNSPWPRPGERHVPGLLWRRRDRKLVPLIGGPNPGVLTVYGTALRRRDGIA